MSRSYRKSPVIKDKNNKYIKKLANSKIRKIKINEKLQNGKNYKKIMCSWDICDYWIWRSKREVIKDYNGDKTLHLEDSSLDKYSQYYYKYARRKQK